MASADNNRSVSPLVQRTKRRGTALSCAECRRLKLKCSRVFPCGNCVKKGCGAICPDGSLTTGKGNRFVLANTEDLHDKISQLATRVRQLEDALAHSHRISSSQPHPLLSDELLQIKRPLERERTDGTPTKEKKPDTNDTIDAMGSLSISERGRSTFFGQTANSWYLLRNEQGSDEEEKSPGSDLSIPSSIPSDVPWLSFAFPFTPIPSNKDAVRNSIINLLPDPSSAQRLCELYYRHAAWMYNPVSKAEFYGMVYRPIYNSESGFPVIRSHYLAIMFMVLAIGALLDTDRPAHSQEATQYYELGRAALAVDSVFEDQSISAIQALLLMCHYMFLDDIEGPRWATMGLVVKLAQSVGLHRDSGKWNLDSDETLRRRSLLWEIFTYDSWQSLTYGRPPSFDLAHINTEKPFPKTKNVHGEVEMSFASWKHSFCSECLSVVMEQAFGARPPSYKIIQDMDKKVRTYYVPPSLQIPGFGKTPIGQEFEQPTIQLIFQRYIAFAIREITLFYLHRGFFARALEDSPNDPMGSKYGPSVLAAYTSACSFVSLIDSMFRQYAVLTERMWFLFTHVFSCSIVLGSIACKVHMAIAPSALSHLDMAHKLFLATTESSRKAKVLPIMHKLTERAHAALAGIASAASPLSAGSPPVKSEEDELAALGGMTRLVPRKPSSAPSTPSYSGSSPKSDPASPSPIQSTIPEQSPYPSPEQTTTWQYPMNQDYVEQSQYGGQYSNPQLQHGVSSMNGITDPYFGYSNSQYYRHEYDNTFNGGISNVGDYNLPVETGDSWNNLVAAQFKPM
ncbi:fungal-specific transcription factor domain-containing protein [Lentinula raphanica]|uniref:Fungal-specific transcription factor domain-containing protein n=1 Tax=Lentinula raphanica TaxID=153919 RepID=A0AA38P4N1_9AGAR|nr:fungal-specific transcription factor domain-containing protein [Lentinula raphanica]KAJ3836080.1 fungal-specific transcription factor domain-containing protein [Lentinula raphanica]KAJ3968663.1 fungal-specific transcription factor domain-containing protein [Lentinula raphanica]